MKSPLGTSPSLPTSCPGLNLRKAHRHLEFSGLASLTIAGVFSGTLQADEEVRNYRTPAAAFIMITQGAGYIRCNETFYTAQPNKIIHVGKDMMIHMKASEAPLTYFFVMYQAGLPDLMQKSSSLHASEESPAQSHYELSLVSAEYLSETFHHMLKNWSYPGILEKIHTKKLFYEIIYEMFAQLQEQLRGVKHEDPVAQTIQYIEEHYMQPLSSDSLAALAGYSTGYLSQLFKTQTGYSPIDYLIRYRVNRAKELLANSAYSLKEIAAHVGYADASYFSRIFKKIEGISPHRYKLFRLNR
ncbi:helix-turn-helix domain-containing protein [Paenibacillus hexagrammi]|uniref:AraC family transcriptional regulator n=1 Tax=Paenibacillus hexagrammi TaxID=2908839 RepID=A0ABY3SJU4_9BACL|nr:AraC family transcriptional regulator [Paenibacillus sp. YPD9-1]UJF33486.1 AraC family transcriptional regulator [Paenibacillus sp. YPD9-1]